MCFKKTFSFFSEINFKDTCYLHGNLKALLLVETKVLFDMRILPQLRTWGKFLQLFANRN